MPETSDDMANIMNSVFMYSSDGITVVDGKGKVVAVNKVSCQLFGIKKEEVLGKHSRDFLNKGLWDKSTALKVLALKKQVTEVEYSYRTQKYILVTGTPVFDENGEISLVVENERDATELNKLKNELQNAKLMKEKYQEEINKLSLLELKKQNIIAQSEEMRDVMRIGLKCAQMEVSNILILGESGTGKGLLSKFIHDNSKRKRNSFIQINCAALPENLLEAELFGYEEGAFTGAKKGGKVGLFELSNDGTLFLDEIGELSSTVQAKLLKYLDDQVVIRLGGTKPIKTNCIIIAATNRDLSARVNKGLFRQDLFYRLNTFSIRVPPLRRRKEDIYSLTNYFLQKYNRNYGKQSRYSPGVLKSLYSYNFPGNVRELKNIIHNAIIMSETDLVDELILKNLENLKNEMIFQPNRMQHNSLRDQISAIEVDYLKRAAQTCRTTREMAAYVGTSQTSLIRKLKKYGIRPTLHRNRFK
jgi:PAS domain S-box-containing protein